MSIGPALIDSDRKIRLGERDIFNNQPQFNGPFSFGAYLFMIAINPVTDRLTARRSADGGATWTEADSPGPSTKAPPYTSPGDGNSMGFYLFCCAQRLDSQNRIRIAYMAPDGQLAIGRFDCSANGGLGVWNASHTGGPFKETFARRRPLCCVVRSTDTVVVVYFTDAAPIYEVTTCDAAGTWGTPQDVTQYGFQDFVVGLAIGPSGGVGGDRVFIFKQFFAVLGPVGSLYYVIFESNDTLGSFTLIFDLDPASAYYYFPETRALSGDRVGVVMVQTTSGSDTRVRLVSAALTGVGVAFQNDLVATIANNPVDGVSSLNNRPTEAAVVLDGNGLTNVIWAVRPDEGDLNSAFVAQRSWNSGTWLAPVWTAPDNLFTIPGETNLLVGFLHGAALGNGMGILGQWGSKDAGYQANVHGDDVYFFAIAGLTGSYSTVDELVQ